jgi:hypothetical protein
MRNQKKTTMRLLLIGFCAGAGAAALVAAALFFFMRAQAAPSYASIAVASSTPVLERDSTVSDAPTQPGLLRFDHPTYYFSLVFPDDLSPKRYKEGYDSETIVFEPKDEQRKGYGFQIFVTPYAGSAITQSRIAEDIPGADIEEPVEVVIGGGIHALVFWSNAAEIGRTREAWFVHGGHLYEVTAFADEDAWLAKILSTLQFTR